MRRRIMGPSHLVTKTRTLVSCTELTLLHAASCSSDM